MKLNYNRYFVIMIIILLTDISIFLDIPGLRQVIGFLTFTIIPGFLITCIMPYNIKIDLGRFILSVGLSIAFLVITGLLINQSYLAIGISKPLSTRSLVVSLSLILCMLDYIAYRKDTSCSLLCCRFPQLKQNELLSPILIPFVFPFLSIFGTTLMNTQKNNIILIIMIFLIAAYIIFIIYWRELIPTCVYPIAIYTIALSLLLMHGLTSNYVNGSDVHDEYHAFLVVSDNLYWSMSAFRHPLTATLSTSLLPTIYWSILDINKLYIYKLIYQILWALVPLVCYIIFSRYVEDIDAFIASMFFISQTSFIVGLQSAMRSEIAILFFALSLMIFFEMDLDKCSSTIYFILFTIMVVLSHYSTSYIFFIMFFMLCLIQMLIKSIYITKFDVRFNVSLPWLILLFAVIFLWYSQITNTTFSSGVFFVKNTLESLCDMFIMESRQQGVLTVVGTNVDRLAAKINLIIYWITFVFIFFGIFDSIRTYNDKLSTLNWNYIALMLISGCILALMVILPYVSKAYGIYRLYCQLLVILAISFVYGGKAICRYIRYPQLSILVITIVLVLQFFSATYTIHQLLGIPHSVDLNRDGNSYKELYIHDQEVLSAKWLNRYGLRDLNIYTDSVGYTRLLMGFYNAYPRYINTFYETNLSQKCGYIYLTSTNKNYNVVFVTHSYNNISDISQYSYLFTLKNKIYMNYRSEVWI